MVLHTQVNVEMGKMMSKHPKLYLNNSNDVQTTKNNKKNDIEIQDGSSTPWRKNFYQYVAILTIINTAHKTWTKLNRQWLLCS